MDTLSYQLTRGAIVVAAIFLVGCSSPVSYTHLTLPTILRV